MKLSSTATILAVLGGLCMPAAAGEVDLGRTLYFGIGPEAPTGSIAGVASRTLSCAGCHGRDAGGGTEGAQGIPPVDGETLRGLGYDAAGLALALSSGRAPGGRELALAMPRYALGGGQAAALWSFLSAAAAEDAAGVRADAVTFLIPASAAHMPAADSLQASLSAAFAQIGRVFGRRILVRAVPVEDTTALPEGFAALGLAADDAPARAAALRAGLPIIAPRGDKDPAGLPRDTVFIQAGEAAVRAALRERASGAGHRPMEDAVVVLDAQALAQLATNPQAAGERTVILSARLADAHPAEIRRLLAAKARVEVMRPAGDLNALPQVAEVTAAVVQAGLTASGRGLTRRRFLSGLRGTSVSVPFWPALDYRQVPIHGTTQVRSSPLAPEE